MACILFCTLPVTVSSAKRSFSKLKLVKSYLRSSIAQDRLNSLVLISIENEAARQLDLDELVNKFANNKARKKRVLSSGWQRQSLQITLYVRYTKRTWTNLMNAIIVLAYIRILQLHMLCYKNTVYCILFWYISIFFKCYMYNSTCKHFFYNEIRFFLSLHHTPYHFHITLFMGGQVP